MAPESSLPYLDVLDTALLVVPNPRGIDPSFEELLESVRLVGIQSPLEVAADRATTLNGGRRHRAATSLGILKVPVRVNPQVVTQQDIDAACVAFDVQQKRPLIDLAVRFDARIAAAGCTQQECAEYFRVSPATVSRGLMLVKTTPAIREALAAKKLTSAHLIAVGKLDPARREELLIHAAAKQLTAAELAKLARPKRGPRREERDLQARGTRCDLRGGLGCRQPRRGHRRAESARQGEVGRDRQEVARPQDRSEGGVMLAYLFLLLSGGRGPPEWLPGVTLGMLHASAALLGATGSGKTICIKRLVRLIAGAGHGLFLPLAKPNDLPWALAACGDREPVVLQPLCGYRINPFSAISKRLDVYSQSVQAAGIFSAISSAVTRLDNHAGGGESSVWIAQSDSLVRNAVALILEAKEEPSFDAIQRVILTSAHAPEELASEEYRRGDNFRYCSQSHAAGAPRQVRDYWAKSWPRIPERQKQGILAQVLPTLDITTKGEIGAILNGQPTHDLGEMIERGDILVADFPPPVYGTLGIAINTAIKESLMRAALSRAVTPASKTTFLVIDEYPLFASEFDSVYLATARSSKCPVVMALQGIESLNAIWPREEARAQVILGNTAFRIHCRPTVATAKLLCESLGGRVSLMFSGGGGGSPYSEPSELLFGANQQANVSFQQTVVQWLHPSELANLRTGSDSDGAVVDLIVTPGFNAPYRKVSLKRE